MAGGRGRAGVGEYARRVNAAAELLEAGVPAAEAARDAGGAVRLLGAPGAPLRRSGGLVGRAAIPEATTVFTVKLPAALVARVRERARESGSTISALVAQALTEFLARGHRKRLRR